MRVLNVVSVVAATEGGGNGERTVQLSRALSRMGMDTTVLSLSIGDTEARRAQLEDGKLVIAPCANARFQLPALWRVDLNELVRGADVVQAIGYWSVLGAATCLAARSAGVPYVVSPAGALPIFGRSKTYKRLFNAAVGRRLIAEASGWVAITKAEVADFTAYGVDPERVRVIPNGVNEADLAAIEVGGFREKAGLGSAPYILFVGRLNPIKGPDLLLEAFLEICEVYPDVTLVFAGPDEGMRHGLEERARAAGASGRVRFLGFIAGRDKAAAYRGAQLLVVPSRSEAMSIVAVEGGICGTPVLMTDQCGLADLDEVDARLTVEVSAQGLERGLKVALEDRDRLARWGHRWQEIVRARFLWKDIARDFEAYFHELAARRGGGPPAVRSGGSMTR